LTNERRRARRAALQSLFEVDQAGHDPERSLEYWVSSDGLSHQGLEFASNLVREVIANKAAIDAIIAEAAPAWPVEQVASTDRVALEIGVYEVCIERAVPIEVAINEAVELAKTFGGENSAAFVNGVLRGIAERQSTNNHATATAGA